MEKKIQTETGSRSVADVRKEIDTIDRQIASLIEKRMRRTDEIGEIKAEKGLPVSDPAREDAVLEALTSSVSPDVRQDLTALYRLLFARSRARQSELRAGSGENSLRVLVLNGPNLDMLGIREPELYGNKDYASLVEFIGQAAKEEKLLVSCVQSNSEPELIDRIHASMGRYDGIVFNPAAYTHTSVALLDALKAVGLPCVEVHLTDVSSREPFRAVSYVRQACIACVTGEGFEGYRKALKILKEHLLPSENK